MAAYDLEEQEQLEALKQWWRRYGNAVLGAITVVLLAVAGGNGWRWYQDHRASQAMGYFEALEDAAREHDADSLARMKAAAQTLRTEFGATPYASRGALLAAQVLFQNQDYDGARAQLEWVAAGKDAAMAAVARLRLAGVLLDQQRYDEALAQLARPPAAFAALYADRRGDVLAAQGKRNEARLSWESALAGLTEAGDAGVASVIRLKIDALQGGSF